MGGIYAPPTLSVRKKYPTLNRVKTIMIYSETVSGNHYIYYIHKKPYLVEMSLVEMGQQYFILGRYGNGNIFQTGNHVKV